MPPRTSWRNLLPGLLGLAAVVALGVAAIVFGNVGRTRGKTLRLYALTDQAQGVLNGTPVWLVGQKVGTVDRVDFRSPSVDSANRVVLVLTVSQRGAHQIRRNSVAQIRTGGTVIGPAVVYITAGTPDAPALRDGDTLQANLLADRADVAAKLGEAARNFGPIMADTRTIMAHLRGRNGSARALGSLVEQHDGEVARFRSHIDRLRDLTSGTALADARDAAAMARVALARADSVRALINSPNTSLGRMRRDSTLATTVASLREELDSVRAAMNSVHGNIGRMRRDSAITRALADVQREMALLAADVKRHPRRYLVF